MVKEEKADNYDFDNLCLFEEHICLIDLKSDEDNHALKEEVMKQDGFFNLLQIESICIQASYYESRPNIGQQCQRCRQV